MKERYHINLLPYKEVLKLCKKYFRKFEKYNNKIPLLGDAIYSNSNELINLTLKKDLIPVFKIKKPLHNEIKSKERKLVKEIYDKYKNSLFKKRFDIEGFFGNVKNKFFCFVNASTQEVAKINCPPLSRPISKNFYIHWLCYLL